MTREEIAQAIENGENVWVVDKDLKRVIPYTANSIIVNNFNADALGYNFEDLYKTKAEAEHYLHRANITRIEQLPFLTWEEFNENTSGFEFADNIGNKYRCHIVRDYNNGKDCIVLYDKNGTVSIDEEWEATEANFYKAYDECVRLFKGEE